MAESETSPLSRLAATDRAYVEWLAAERGITMEEAFSYARRPRRLPPFQPAGARPVIERRIGNVLQFPLKIKNGRRPGRRRRPRSLSK
jgi:hypothetical protein